MFSSSLLVKECSDGIDAPQQILLGASNSKYCVLLGLARWLELNIAKFGPDNQFIFNYCWEEISVIIKENADTILKKY